MATIRRRSGGYNVQIRKQGYSTITKTFSSITTARKWAAGVEADMERHLYTEVSESITLRPLLNRYQDEVIALLKGSKSEKHRIQHLKKYLGNLGLTHLSPHEVSKYRDIRLETVSPASLKRELVILSRLLTVAERDWGICIPKNPIPLVSLPKVDKGRTRRLEKGLNPVEVATITGHKDPRMLMRYTHLRAEDLVQRLG